ncbi:MAG: PfaD family polyunsaturated fatty acid/polyketide biosynthesis protein, partial [Planctomycetia bacterium]
VAKVSRSEVAAKFLAPAPDRLLAELVRQEKISREEAALAAELPLADDLTAEADSGGHTDNRPLVALAPALIALRDRLQAKHQYRQAPRVGAAGGVSTPHSVAAAFALGAAYVVTGSVNQACVESGSCDAVRKMLADADQADVIMAPAADMFEMGVKVQVLKRGTMFALRAAKLYEIYRAYPAIELIPADERGQLEAKIFRASLDEIWNQTRDYFARRDPRQIERAEREPHHKMALVFRWYLGQASRWANVGEPTRTLDYQVWCGPAMGAFNEWTRDSFLARPAERRAAVVARNLLLQAAVLLRAQSLQHQGVMVPPEAARVQPLEAAELQRRLTAE